jgi:DNA gyrase subunit A
MAGIRLAAGARAVFFGAVPQPVARDGVGDDAESSPVVVTVAGSGSALPGTDTGSVKVTNWSAYPAKGRGTGGVRAHRFLRGEDTLLLAYAGPGPARAAAGSGAPVDLPSPDNRRDGSGAALDQPVAAIAGPVRVVPSHDIDASAG